LLNLNLDLSLLHSLRPCWTALLCTLRKKYSCCLGGADQWHSGRPRGYFLQPARRWEVCFRNTSL